MQSTRRSWWAFGAGAVVVFWITVLVAGLLATPPYSHIDNALSTLGLADPPFGLIARLAFVVLGLGSLLFALHFRRYAGHRSALVLGGVALLVIHGLGRIGEGLFPPLDGTIWRTLHTIFGVPAVLAMPVLPFVLAAWARRSQLGGLATTSLVFGILFVLLMILGVVVGAFPLGLGQRIGFLLWYVWLIWALSPRSLRAAAT